MLHTLSSQIMAATGLLVCLAALVFGSWRERAGAVFYAGAFALSLGLGTVSQQFAVWRFLLTDIICLLGFFYLSWKSPHPWPLWAAGLQLLAAAADVFALVNAAPVLLWTVLTVVNGCSYLVLLSLLIGTWEAARAKNKQRGRPRD